MNFLISKIKFFQEKTDWKLLQNHYLIIVITTFFAHGLLLLNDGVYWDGWLIFSYIQDDRWDLMNQMFTEAGLPVTAYLHWFIGLLPNFVFFYKLIVFSCILISGILTYEIAKKVNLDNSSSLWIALLSLVYPAYLVEPELIMLPYSICYTFFMLGAFLALIYIENNQQKTINILLRLTSLFLLFWSFAIPSLIVFYVGFLIIFYLSYHQKINSPKIIFSTIFNFALKHIDFLALPIVFWTIKKIFWKTSGLYSDYNQIKIDLSVIINSFNIFIKYGFFSIFNQSITFLTPLSLLFLSILGIVVFDKLKLFNNHNNLHKNSLFVSLLYYGFILFFLGVIPYCLVGKSILYSNDSVFETRHSLLIVLPISIIIFASSQIIINIFKSDFCKKIISLYLIILLIFFSDLKINNYFKWQARWVVDRSIMINLCQQEMSKNVSVFWIDNQFPVKISSYSFYEWSSMLNQCSGKQSQVGIDISATNGQKDIEKFKEENQIYFTEHYNLKNFNPDGKQAQLTIKAALPYWRTPKELSIWYWGYKFLKPAKLNDFLRKITNIEIEYL